MFCNIGLGPIQLFLVIIEKLHHGQRRNMQHFQNVSAQGSLCLHLACHYYYTFSAFSVTSFIAVLMIYPKKGLWCAHLRNE